MNTVLGFTRQNLIKCKINYVKNKVVVLLKFVTNKNIMEAFLRRYGLFIYFMTISFGTVIAGIYL
jgi:hypothetical protein